MKKKALRVVFTNGCFDILHPGHIKVLKEAKKLGDVLHVGINSDNSIQKIKGPHRPILNQEQRYEVVSSIRYVDYVHIFDEPTPIKLIEKIRPDIIVKGGDWKVEDVVGNNLAEVVIIPIVFGISTTEIINKIVRGNINAFKEGKGAVKNRS